MTTNNNNENEKEKELLTIILNKCGVCYDCGVKDWNVELNNNNNNNKCNNDVGVCPICWNIKPDVMEECMNQVLDVYGGWKKKNKFSKECPTISNSYLPFLQLTQYAVTCAIKTTATTTTTTTTKVGKEWMKQVLVQVEKRHMVEKTDEDGCMSYHVVPTPPSIFLSSLANYIPSLQQSSLPSSFHRKKKRRRFRGNDPTLKQGGHPCENLELRIQQTSNNNEETFMQHFIESNSSMVHTILQTILDNHQYQEELAKWIQFCAKQQSTSSPKQSKNSHIYVAAWRHAFYIKGEYTKHGSNISQTPFYVPSSNTGEMIKKGTTSIEEEICPQVVKWGCQGISIQNNSPLFPDIVYGMCKFHASGREDINVRMFYSPPGNHNNNNNQNKIIGGRPFVCKVVDAHRIPTLQQLQSIVHAVNHTNNKEDESENNHTPKMMMTKNGSCDDGVNNNPNFYGCNPNGVGISPKLEFCSDLNFRNLQSDTENKVKYYGCYCWSQKPIVNLKEELSVKFPLEIQQKTPLRVLHRRSSMIRTRIIHDIHSFEQIDDHHFILHLSTSAGTYVKEFVHGDCGRTIPSISSILQCKTDILQLDCEGVAIE